MFTLFCYNNFLLFSDAVQHAFVNHTPLQSRWQIPSSNNENDVHKPSSQRKIITCFQTRYCNTDQWPLRPATLSPRISLSTVKRPRVIWERLQLKLRETKISKHVDATVLKLVRIYSKDGLFQTKCFLVSLWDVSW